MAQFRWNPDSYLASMRAEVPEYERLQDESAAGTSSEVRRVLELGAGSRIAEQLSWITAAGLRAQLLWANRDLAVLAGERSSS